METRAALHSAHMFGATLSHQLLAGRQWRGPRLEPRSGSRVQRATCKASSDKKELRRRGLLALATSGLSAALFERQDAGALVQSDEIGRSIASALDTDTATVANFSGKYLDKLASRAAEVQANTNPKAALDVVGEYVFRIAGGQQVSLPDYLSPTDALLGGVCLALGVFATLQSNDNKGLLRETDVLREEAQNLQETKQVLSGHLSDESYAKAGVEAKYAQLQEDFKDKTRHVALLMSEREKDAREMVVLRNQLSKTIESAEDSAAEAAETIQELETDLRGAEDREAQLKKVLVKEGEEVASLVSELEAKQGIINKNKRSLRNIQVEANKLRMGMDTREKDLMEGLEQEDLVKAAIQLADQKIKTNKGEIEDLSFNLEQATNRIESVERWGKLICQELESVSNVLHEIDQERDSAVAAGRAMAIELEEKGDSIIELENEMRQINVRQKGLINDLNERNQELDEMRTVMMELCKQQNSSIRVLENQLASSAKRVKTLEKDLAAKNDHITRMGKQLHQLERARKEESGGYDAKLAESAKLGEKKATSSTASSVSRVVVVNGKPDGRLPPSGLHSNQPNGSEKSKTPAIGTSNAPLRSMGINKGTAESKASQPQSPGQARTDSPRPTIVPDWVHAGQNRN